MLRIRRKPDFVPGGYRVAANGFDLELVANEHWRSNPFDQHCRHRTMPNKALVDEARLFMPTFDPEYDPLAWSTLGAIVRQLTGRSAEELVTMGQDDVVACLRACNAVGSREVLRAPVAEALPARSHGRLRTGPSKVKQKPTVDQRLKELHGSSPQTAESQTLRGLARILNCSPGAFSGGEYYEKTLKPRREEAKVASPRERNEAENRQAIRDYRTHKESFEESDARIDAWYDQKKKRE